MKRNRAQRKKRGSIFKTSAVVASVVVVLGIGVSLDATLSRSGQFASAGSSISGDTVHRSGGACEQTYNRCMQNPQQKDKQMCEQQWKQCVSKKCVVSGSASYEKCPKDPDCESSCTESGTTGSTECCVGGPKHNNSCPKKIGGVCDAKTTINPNPSWDNQALNPKPMNQVRDITGDENTNVSFNGVSTQVKNLPYITENNQSPFSVQPFISENDPYLDALAFNKNSLITGDQNVDKELQDHTLETPQQVDARKKEFSPADSFPEERFMNEQLPGQWDSIIAGQVRYQADQQAADQSDEELQSNANSAGFQREIHNSFTSSQSAFQKIWQGFTNLFHF